MNDRVSNDETTMKNTPHNGSVGHDDLASCLSAFLDGEAAATESACARWRGDANARRTWHAYHLIGDVMRSDELATAPAHDAAFLAGMRTRLAAEPAMLAPASLPERLPVQAARRRQAWVMPVAAAAGFVVVAGVLVMTRTAAPGSAADEAPMRIAAQAPPQTSAASLRASAVLAADRQPAVNHPLRDPALIRDARLDEYLRAHQAAGGLSVATPGGWLRRVDAVVAQPPER